MTETRAESSVLCPAECIADIHRETTLPFFLIVILRQRFYDYSGAKFFSVFALGYLDIFMEVCVVLGLSVGKQKA